MSFPPTVDRYRIDRVLGSGAFASVWLGHDDALDSHVAIKVLSGSLIDDLDVRNRFLEEARILRRADSARLVRVHDIGELPDGRPYFVMSYADRGTLADRMRERPLPVAQALALAEDIAYGVEVINRLGVIHRDLKPSNVLFQSTQEGGERLLIADLGLAKALAHASGAFTLPVGTPGYMSPEQARFGGGLDVRADVYGLGALTYHMLTGRPPGVPPIKVAPSTLREELSPAFDQVVLRAMEVEREKRWPTAEAFAEALSTLRPTSAPGRDDARGRHAAGAPDVLAPAEAEPTVQDQFYPTDPSYGQGQGQGSYGQGQGLPGPPPPIPGQTYQPSQGPPPRYPEPEPSTMEDAQDPGMTSMDDGRTVAVPPPYQGGQPGQQQPPPPQSGENKTALFPLQGPPQGPPQGSPYQGPPPPGGGQQPPGPYGPGQAPMPGPFHEEAAGPNTTGPRPGGRHKAPAQPGKRNMAPLIIAAVVLVLGLAGGLLLGSQLVGGDDEPQKKKPKQPAIPQDFVQIADASGKIKTAVPKVWPRGQEPTWSPTAVGLNDPVKRPVLRATPSVAGFLGDGRSPGVFIGLTTDVANGKLPPPSAARHPQCTKANPENYTSPDKALTGTITRFSKCQVGTPTVVEIGLRHSSGKYGAWVRVKETNGRNATKDILDNLKLAAP